MAPCLSASNSIKRFISRACTPTSRQGGRSLEKGTEERTEEEREREREKERERERDTACIWACTCSVTAHTEPHLHTHIHTYKRRYVDLIDSDVEPHTSYKEVEWEEDDNDDNEEKVLSTMLSCWHLNMHTCMCLALAST